VVLAELTDIPQPSVKEGSISSRNGKESETVGTEIPLDFPPFVMDTS
jgi:hypothetical protein